MQLWDQLVNAICRPPRIEYTKKDLPGGERCLYRLRHHVVKREDFVITNKKELALVCSQWQLDEPRSWGATGEETCLPCVIYCHCNSGSRLDAEEAIWSLVPMGIRVFALDFSGSGLSEGEYVTLGANEVEDLQCLVDFIRAGGHTSSIALWGRSMGAVTSLLFSGRDPSIAGVVLDSPFSKLTDLMVELVDEQKVPLGRYIGGAALKLMRRSVKKRAGFDIAAISPIDSVDRTFVPALFAHALGDTFVKPHHSVRLHERYAGDKSLVQFKGDHNSPRPRSFYQSVELFLAQVLHLPDAKPDVQNGKRDDWLPRDAPALGRTQRMALPNASTASPDSWAAAEELLSHMMEMDDPDNPDIELQAALARSLEDMTLRDSEPASGGGSNAASPVVPALGERRVSRSGHAGPSSAAEEDAMLQAAINASLLDADFPAPREPEQAVVDSAM